MKLLLALFLVIAAPAFAQSKLVSVRFNGRIEQYWIQYVSEDGKYTKVSNANSGIHFFLETRFLNSITVAAHPPKEKQIRVRKRG